MLSREPPLPLNQSNVKSENEATLNPMPEHTPNSTNGRRKNCKDVQEGFTIEGGNLPPSTRRCKRSRAAIPMQSIWSKRMITKKKALLSVEARNWSLFYVQLWISAENMSLHEVLSIHGCSCGRVVFNSEDAQELLSGESP